MLFYEKVHFTKNKKNMDKTNTWTRTQTQHTQTNTDTNKYKILAQRNINQTRQHGTEKHAL